MTVPSRPLMDWARDLALAYAGGLVLGAPFALTAVWLTGYERIATACLLLAMAVVFAALRRRTPRETGSPPGDKLEHDSMASRRAA
jgi:hypothetical protein